MFESTVSGFAPTSARWTLPPYRLDHLKIIVLELMPYGRNDPQFVDHLREQSQRVGYPRGSRT